MIYLGPFGMTSPSVSEAVRSYFMLNEVKPNNVKPDGFTQRAA
jgi:hypothetical protein